MSEEHRIQNQTEKFDRDAFVAEFDHALEQLDHTVNLGQEFGAAGITRIFLVGCGAPNAMMAVVEYWAKRYAQHTDIRRCYSAEFVNQNPSCLDEHTLVILGSDSGVTRETLDAAIFLKNRPCKTLSFTQKASSPLAQNVAQSITYGETRQGYFSSYILAQALMSAFLQQRESGWTLHDQLLKALPHLPAALAEAKATNQLDAAQQAAQLSNERLLYVVGAGPTFTTSYTFAVCFLMEMQWMHAHPIRAAEFFHGPFEAIDRTTPVLVLVGEDPSRSEAQRVMRFCKKHAGQALVYDSTRYAMKDIHPLVRSIVCPFVLDAALTELVENLAIVHNHPLSMRRYMGKLDY
jgi:fructoselysine 6-phosphate deglycase